MSTLAHDLPVGRAEPRAISALDVALLVGRLILGVVFLAHGAQKVLGWFGGSGMAATVAGMGKLGLPAAVAYLVMSTEFLGGLGLIFGVLARLSALGIIALMAGAIAMVHFPNGFFMNWFGNQKGEGYEYHLLAIALAFIVLLAGPGKLALMDAEARLFRRTQP